MGMVQVINLFESCTGVVASEEKPDYCILLKMKTIVLVCVPLCPCKTNIHREEQTVIKNALR